MALFHLSVTQTKRSAGQSAIASAAYQAGERLYSEYYGEYTRKGGVSGKALDRFLSERKDTRKVFLCLESDTAQAQMLILELLADGKRMPSAELEKTVNERGISSRTMRTAKSRIGDRLVTEKDGTAWVCYLRD